jgi:hypothetical protein
MPLLHFLFHFTDPSIPSHTSFPTITPVPSYDLASVWPAPFVFHNLSHSPNQQAGPQKGEQDFTFDVKTYVAGAHRTAGHICHFPDTNQRFTDKVPLPTQGKLIFVVGYICRQATQSFSDDNLKHIVLNVADIAFLSPDKCLLLLPRCPPIVSSQCNKKVALSMLEWTFQTENA